MAAAADDPVDLVFAVSGRKNVVFLAHFFKAQPCLEQSAAGSSADILTDKRIQVVAGKSLLCQEDLRAGSFFDAAEDLQIPYEFLLVNDETRCWDFRYIKQNDHLIT